MSYKWHSIQFPLVGRYTYFTLLSVMLDTDSFYDQLQELKRLSLELVDEAVQYAKDTMEHLTIAVCIYICLCVVIYFATVYLKQSQECGHLRTIKNVLFVIAHPDDECMFFGPIIVTLAQRNDCQMFLLCLSEGNYERQGKTRKQELWNSCNILGIPESHITLCNGLCNAVDQCAWT